MLKAPQSEFDLALPAVQGSGVDFLFKASVAAACFALQPSLALTVERNKAACLSANPASKGSCSQVTIKQPMILNLWLMRGTCFFLLKVNSEKSNESVVWLNADAMQGEFRLCSVA